MRSFEKPSQVRGADAPDFQFGTSGILRRKRHCCAVSGVLWNLSSRDSLKEKLAVEALQMLTEKVLVPLCKSLPLTPSEKDIFNNTTGCLR